MSSALDWDLLRVFLALMRAENLRAAAMSLGISHPTVRRRLDALEAQLGLRLFERRPGGLHATTAAADLLELAQQVEAAVDAVSRRASASDPKLRGTIRVSVANLLMHRLLMPDLAAFAARWPEIALHVEPTNDVADLHHRQADVAIRAMPHGRSPRSELVGRKAATLHKAVYGSDHAWIGWFGDERDRAWMNEYPFPDRPIVCSFPDMHLQHAACVEGLGLAVLLCFMAGPELVRRTEPEPLMDVWIVVHPDLRRAPRLRLFRDEMAAALERLRPRIEGRDGIIEHVPRNRR